MGLRVHWKCLNMGLCYPLLYALLSLLSLCISLTSSHILSHISYLVFSYLLSSVLFLFSSARGVMGVCRCMISLGILGRGLSLMFMYSWVFCVLYILVILGGCVFFLTRQKLSAIVNESLCVIVMLLSCVKVI
jgi:hypothetical protein